MIKKFCSVFLIVTVLFSLLLSLSLDLPSYAAKPTATEAQAALLYCFHTDSTLFSENSKNPIAPGNTAQLMTALLTIEAYPDLEETVTLHESLLPGWYVPNDYRTPADYGFTKGASVPVKDLLAAMVIENSNCAAYLLAALIGGTRSDFVTQMNERADAIGMIDTVYKDPAGLDTEGAFTTADDLLLLSRLLYQNQAFYALASAATYRLAGNGFSLHTRNYMLGGWYTRDYLYPSADGMKAGSTPNSGYTLLATATEQDGYTYLAIILGGQDQSSGYSLAKSLFRYGSTSFSYREVLSNAKLITTLPVKNGDGISSLPLFPKESISAYLAKDTKNDELVISYTLTHDLLTAPFEKGKVVGEVTVSYRDEVIAKTELVTASSVMKAQKAGLPAFLQKAVTPVLIILGIALLLVIIRISYAYWMKKHPQD